MKRIILALSLAVFILSSCVKKDDTNKVNKNICVDPDGREYNTVQLGDQLWMAENYAYLPKVHKPSQRSLTKSRYYVYKYDGTDIAEAKERKTYKVYGAMYNFAAAVEVAPEGWHLPTDDEWKELETFVGVPKADLDKMSFRGKDLGISPKLRSDEKWYGERNGTNELGFNAYPSGSNNYSYGFMGLTLDAVYISSTPANKENHVWKRILTFDNDGFGRNVANLSSGFAVRYIKDKE